MRPSENWRPSSASAYYLGSAESPTSDFFKVWLKSSRSGDVASRSCSPQVTWALRPPSLYGRRLSRTVPAVVPAWLVKMSAPGPNICGRIYFHHFLGKNQKSISAYKCPITAPKIRESEFILVLDAACMHVVLHPVSLLISPFCCRGLFRYKKGLWEAVHTVCFSLGRRYFFCNNKKIYLEETIINHYRKLSFEKDALKFRK